MRRCDVFPSGSRSKRNARGVRDTWNFKEKVFIWAGLGEGLDLRLY